jgi:hypothetical protein
MRFPKLPDTTVAALWLASLSRFFPGLIYLATVYFVIDAVAHRSSPSVQVVTRDLARNHVLAPEDLETGASEALIGQHLRVAVKKGDMVTAAMVAPKPDVRVLTNTIAAVVTITNANRALRHIEIGSLVQVCRGSKPFGVPVMVIGLDCDEQACLAIVNPPKMPIDEEVLADADIIPTLPDVSCLGKSR